MANAAQTMDVAINCSFGGFPGSQIMEALTAQGVVGLPDPWDMNFRIDPRVIAYVRQHRPRGVIVQTIYRPRRMAIHEYLESVLSEYDGAEKFNTVTIQRICRVEQLEDFITARGLEVPDPAM